jgi:CspA family cold shock protein
LFGDEWMELQDQILPCDTCGGQFTFSGSEAAFYAERGFSMPKRCAGARKAKKQGVLERYSACPFGAENDRRGHGGGSTRSHTERGGWPRPRPDVEGTGVILAGVVSSLNLDRGFGFIDGADGNTYFFDAREVSGGDFHSLQKGRPVRFEEAHSPRGPRARSIETV